MQVKCNYCGSFIEDSLDFCPNCGAVNENKKRLEKDTPKTIGELEAWYKARNLPPYETTRFFIGVNYKSPRAFGIYKDGENFVVYKNKADGSRAVRYSGPDEAYAVNELYLRLKEEILNQKSRSVRSNSSGAQTSRRKRRGFQSLITTLITFLIFGGVFAGAFSAFVSDETQRKNEPKTSNYYYHDSDIFYLNPLYGSGDKYEWWKYDESLGDYVIYQTTQAFNKKEREKSFVDGFDNSSSVHGYSTYDLFNQVFPSGTSDESSAFTDKYDIHNSRNYKDQHHYKPSSSGYYVVNDTPYYYLDDRYTSDGQRNYGWYVFTNNAWTYLTDGDDKSVLGDELWYDDDKYYIGDSFSDYKSGSIYQYADGESWTVNENAFDFEDTEYYEDYESAKTSYNERIDREESERNDSSFWSDSDNDYDWDSGYDSWDSGGSDWDSDW